PRPPPTTVQGAGTTGRQPTTGAASRWPCSKSTPPTMGGKTCPNESGQSGTARPEPVLVTSPPRKSSTSVAPAVATARRWRPEPECSAMPSRDTLLRATDVPPPDTSDPVGASLRRPDTGSRARARLSLLRSSDDISSSADISGARLPVPRPETTSGLVRGRWVLAG